MQAMEGGEPTTDMNAIVLMCGIVWIALPALIEGGITAGYLKDDDGGGIGLSDKGQHWYERDLLRRD